jgi:hypothetical protein
MSSEVPFIGKSRSGRRIVSYRDAIGRTKNAHVISAGTNSGLKLRVESGRRPVDDVPLCTSEKGTSCYMNRKPA